MQYFDVDTLYDEIPTWVNTVLSLGYRWRQCGSNARRRMGLLSMPFESEVAGFIALGALRKDLEYTTTNHVDTYFDLLLQVCQERVRSRIGSKYSLENSEWDLRNVRDDTCWRFVEHDGYLDAIILEDARYRPVVKQKGKYNPNQNGACRCYLMRNNAINWQLRDSPSLQLEPGERSLDISDYCKLPDCVGPIKKENLSQTYQGLVLVGGGAERDSRYMQKFYTTGFIDVNRKLPLGDLLTIHHSDRKYIQRLRFLNERAEVRQVAPLAKLVVADGISALLNAEKMFRDSDIIGVCNRDASEESILQLKEFMNDKVRYYTDIDTSHYLQGDMPVGMMFRVLQRRS